MSFQIHTGPFCPPSHTHIKQGFCFAVWQQRAGATWFKADNSCSLWQGGHFICFCAGSDIKPSFDFHTWSWVFSKIIALSLQTYVQIKGLAPTLREVFLPSEPRALSPEKKLFCSRCFATNSPGAFACPRSSNCLHRLGTPLTAAFILLFFLEISQGCDSYSSFSLSQKVTDP